MNIQIGLYNKFKISQTKVQTSETRQSFMNLHANKKENQGTQHQDILKKSSCIDGI